MRKVGRGASSLMDVLDRVLDKGVVIDATVRVSVIGIDLLGVDAKITVASIETYLQLSEDPRAYELGLVTGTPPQAPAGRDRVLLELTALEATRDEPEFEEHAATEALEAEPVEAGPAVAAGPPAAEAEVESEDMSADVVAPDEGRAEDGR